MARVLLYNFREDARRKKIKALLFRTGVPIREVQPSEQGCPLGVLTGAVTEQTEPSEEISPAEEKLTVTAKEPFSEEMIVMHGLSRFQFNTLLDGMKREGVRVPLKAVTTESNLGWSSARLYRELKEEHRALSEGTAPVHEKP